MNRNPFDGNEQLRSACTSVPSHIKLKYHCMGPGTLSNHSQSVTRYRKFITKTGSCNSSVQVHELSPTFAAYYFHSSRTWTYHQVQQCVGWGDWGEFVGNELNPLEYGKRPTVNTSLSNQTYLQLHAIFWQLGGETARRAATPKGALVKSTGFPVLPRVENAVELVAKKCDTHLDDDQD